MSRPKKIEGEIPTLTSEEIALMRQELAELKAKVQSQKPEPMEEIRKAVARNQRGNEQISIRHFTDHKKVSLYHTNGFHIGKKIGPLHPGLLEYTYSIFKDKGITLSTICPSDSEIAKYKQSEEYLAAEENQKKIKPGRYKKVSVDETQKIIAQFARVIGVPATEAIQLKPEPVGV